MRRPRADRQLPLPGLPAGGLEGGNGPGSRIPHRRILAALEREVEDRGIVDLYRREVLPIKTRTIQLVGRKSRAEILHTLLGYEVKAWFKRIQCPDMVTARYLKLFTELGCRTIKLPYDPTVTARILPELEGAAARLHEGIRRLFPADRRLEAYVTRRVFAHLRQELRRAVP